MTTCPKCGATSGDDWSQCKGDCPLPGTPHYKPPFHAGDRIRLVSMGDDPDPIEPGAEGRVILEPVWFLDAWQVTVSWDNGRSLNLCMPPDRAEKIA